MTTQLTTAGTTAPLSTRNRVGLVLAALLGVVDIVGIFATLQTLADPAGDRDWVVEAVVDCDATDAAGELVLAATALRRL